jgi:short subunit fatty acids transporter
VKYALEWVVTVLQYAVSFYGFWLVWRVLLPALPGPADPDERVAPYVRYFTDPFVVPVANALHIPVRLVALVALVIVAAVSVALGRVPELA